uniref:Peptidyl-prolyl cis-trans isomerase n=1 Tax=uncultured bacterium CSLF43 TaxID=1091575 RepID=G4WW27_9BACT|nr:FKBP-type peptidyl-prolyl cis-trans isomerase [uncultured bacterium CSLF43]
MAPSTSSQKPKVVSFHYTLKDTKGNTLESSFNDEPLSFLEGVGQIIPGLEGAIKDLAKGEKKSVFVKAQDAYGEFEKELVVEVPRAQIPKKDVAVGDRFHADSGHGHSQVVVVTKVTDSAITVDGNHPLAGQDLHFDVEVIDVREATKEELEHGHSHSGDGHHH